MNKCSIESWQQKCLKLYREVYDYKIAKDDYNLYVTLQLGMNERLQNLTQITR